VTRFFNAKNVCLAEIHRQTVEAYGEGAIYEGNVRKVGCSKKAGLMCITTNEVGTQIIQLGNF
jgi:hypothetical protein